MKIKGKLDLLAVNRERLKPIKIPNLNTELQSLLFEDNKKSP